MTNSNSETTTDNTVTFTAPVTPDTFDLEVEVDQENMIKALKALSDAGVAFKLKKVAATPKYAVSIPSVWTTPVVPYVPYVPYTPYTPPWQSPFYYEVTWGAPNADIPVITTSSINGYPPGTQSSFTACGCGSSTGCCASDVE